MDFSQIDDDQLLHLIQSAMNEAVNRGVAMAKAAQDIYDYAAYELQIKRELQAKAEAKAEEDRLAAIKRKAESESKAAEQNSEQEKRAKIWAHSSAVVTALKEDPLFRSDESFSINIWARGNDVRVYLQEPGRNGWEIIYYKTGNSYHPPGSIDGLGDIKDEERMRNFFELLCKKWNVGYKANSSEASKVKPDPTHLAKYKAALQIKESANV